MTDSTARSRERLAFALDFPSLGAAKDALARVGPEVGVTKVGLELFLREGPAAVRLGIDSGTDVFLDLKLHDIPATVERAVRSACQLGARYLTVHGCGGPAMLEGAAKAAVAENTGLTILAVTVLTSMGPEDLAATGVSDSPAQQVLRLATLATDSGAGGLVCSVQEVAQLRESLGPSPLLVTPGIRPAGADVGDQKRTGTPRGAIESGSSLLVVGRPIRDADDPVAAARAICAEIELAL